MLHDIKSLYDRRNLLWQLAKREVIGRYRGSVLGLAWSFVNPLLLLAAYTIVFGVVFPSRWGSGQVDKTSEFALVLFCGMIPYNLLAETLGRAPGLIAANANYVKKVIFPLEILPLSILGAALIHALISFTILLLGAFLVLHHVGIHALWLPVVMLPLLLFAAGAAWFLSSLGVFIRDLQHLIGLFLQLLMFMSPIFYPASALPAEFRPWMLINPLAGVLENTRRVLLWNQPPDWALMWPLLVAGPCLALLGLWWFQYTRKAFADVI